MPGTLVNKNVAPDKRMQDCLTALRDRCLTAAGLTIGSSSAAKVKIANTVTYILDSVFCSKTTAEVAFTATTHDIEADASSVQERCYLVSLASDGTPTLTAGDVATGAGNAVVPLTPAGTTAIGFLRLAVAAGSTNFDASTDLLSAGHLTDSYVDLSVNARDYEYVNE
jgi:hypothetical protein